jgi:hypothetical protein
VSRGDAAGVVSPGLARATNRAMDDFDDDDESIDFPTCRATIRDGSITLNSWNPFLIRGGPIAGMLDGLADRGVVLADLHVLEDGSVRELIVDYVPAGSGSEESDEALIRWAVTVGYRRVWLPDRVVEQPDALPPVGEARVTCPTCGTRWRDTEPEFWELVRSSGCFPASCPACGGSLPEWEACGETARTRAPRRPRAAGGRKR